MTSSSLQDSKEMQDKALALSVCECYIAAKPEAELDHPFGPETSVYKVRTKLFAIYIPLFKGGGPAVNLKCEPNQALALRDVFTAVLPGYHMNKKHWNTVLLDGSVPEHEIERMIDHSYALVASGLKKVERQALIAKFGPELLKP